MGVWGLLATGCSVASSPYADMNVRALTEHWRWRQYWGETTELGSAYRPGREIDAVVFWRTGKVGSVGFCSTELRVCQYYADLALHYGCYDMDIPVGMDAQIAYQRFIRDPNKRVPGAMEPSYVATNPSEFTSERTKFKLPPFEPPEAIRNRTAPPAEQLDKLVDNLKCVPGEANCQVHLLIPYFNDKDPYVPVFRHCSQCFNPKPMIIFMRWIEEDRTWWHGAMDFTDIPDQVGRIRKQIENALLLDARR